MAACGSGRCSEGCVVKSVAEVYTSAMDESGLGLVGQRNVQRREREKRVTRDDGIRALSEAGAS